MTQEEASHRKENTAKGLNTTADLKYLYLLLLLIQLFGNLSFDTSEGEIGDFFGPAVDRITSIRVVTGHDGKPKGFAYVEFGSLDDLKKALAMSGTSVAGRTVRVSVAEPPKRGFGDDSRAAAANEWRRDGPLPSGGGGMMGQGRSTRDYGDRPSQVDEDPERWNSARGSKFVPSAAPSQSSFGGPRRDFSGQSDRSERDFGSGFERGSKFTPSTSGTTTPAGEQSRRSSYMATGASSPLAPPSEADTASVWRRAAPLPSQPTSPNPATSGQTSPSESAAPATRKRLALAPRTQSSANTTATSPPATTSSKPNPFGNAAPVDTAEKEKAIEAKMEKLRLEAQEKANAAPVRSSAFSSSTRGSEKKENLSNSQTSVTSSTDKKDQQPVRIMSNPIRREGLSFANAAGTTSKKDGASSEEVKPAEAVKVDETAAKPEEIVKDRE